MKTQHKIFFLSILFGLIYYIFDAFIDSRFFYEESFWSSLTVLESKVEIYIRLTVFLLFVAFGYILTIIVDKLEKNRAELQRAKEYSESLFETTPNAIFSVDLNKKITSWNKVAEQITGYSAGEMIGQECNMFSGTACKESCGLFNEDVTKPIIGAECIVKRKDGIEVTISKNIDHLRNEKNEVVGGIECFEDIKDRIDAESIQNILYKILEAVTTTDTLEELVGTIHDDIKPIIEANNFFVALYNSETDTYTFPYYRDEHDELDTIKPHKLGKGFTEYVRKTRKPLLVNKEQVEIMIENGDVDIVGTPAESWMGIPLVWGDITLGVVCVQCYNNINAYSEKDLIILTYVSGHIALAIERKINEEKISGNVSLLKSTMESTTDGILVVDLLGKTVFYNKKFNELWKIPEDISQSLDDPAMIEYVLDQLIDPETFSSKIKSLYNTPDKVDNDTLFFKDGRIYERYSQPQYIENEIIGRVWSFKDVTEKNRLEEQLQVRQRMDSLGTLAGGIAHDFNNILVGIMGYIELLKHESEYFTDIHKTYLDKSIKNCKRAATLIKQFQTLSKNSIPNISGVDIHKIAKEVFGLIDNTTNKLIKKEIKVQAKKWYVAANAVQLNQIFLNLATNSVHAIEEKGASSEDFVRISAKRHITQKFDRTGLPEGEYVHIIFEDTGIGMPDNVRKKAFDPLFTTKAKGGIRGQGLGLAMVYNLVTKIFRGYIDIDTEHQKGTRIHIYLPKTDKPTKIKKKEIINVQGHDETILLIDDEDLILEFGSTILEKAGYSVIAINDGQAAVDLYSKKGSSISIIILDLTMPRMSGQMVMERLLEIDKNVKVIISSGHADEYSRNGILAHAKAYLDKPYIIQDLIGVVRKVIELN